MFLFNTPYLICPSFTLSSCYLFRVQGSLGLSLILTASNKNASLSVFPTSSVSDAYYALMCYTSCGIYVGSNAFRISIINCIAPSFNTAVLKPNYYYNI